MINITKGLIKIKITFCKNKTSTQFCEYFWHLAKLLKTTKWEYKSLNCNISGLFPNDKCEFFTVFFYVQLAQKKLPYKWHMMIVQQCETISGLLQPILCLNHCQNTPDFFYHMNYECLNNSCKCIYRDIIQKSSENPMVNLICFCWNLCIIFCFKVIKKTTGTQIRKALHDCHTSTKCHKILWTGFQ